MKVIVDSRVRVGPAGAAELERRGALASALELCTHANPDFAEWLRYRRGRPPARKLCSARRDRRGGWSFPRGRARELIGLFGPGVEVVDARVFAAAARVEWHGHPARPYQRRLIASALASLERRDWVAGLWRSPQGSGKTDTALELVSKMGLRTLVVAPTSGIFSQWEERTRRFLGVEPGVLQGSRRRVGDLVTVGMQQTLVRCVRDVAHEFGAVVFDEAQLGASRTYQEVIDATPAAFRLAVSADERRADEREFLVYDQFGDGCERVTRDEVKEAGGIVEVDVVVVPTAFEAGWYRMLDPADKFEQRHRLLDELVEDEARNELVARLVRGCLDEGEQVVVLSDRREHCDRLDAMVCRTTPSVLLVGGDRQFESNREALASGKVRVAVGTLKAIGVGFESHRELARGVLATPFGNNVRAEMQVNQFLGRYARPAAGKRRAVVYYLLDERVFGVRHVHLLRRWRGKDHVFVQVGDRHEDVNEWLKNKKESKVDAEERLEGDGEGVTLAELFSGGGGGPGVGGW